VVRGDQLPWELNPQGYTRWYAAPTMTDIAATGMIIFTLRIAPGGRSGKQHHPGNQVVYVWRGTSGYSIIDDERFEWENGDVVMVPLRPTGSVVQHFNAGDDEVELLCVSPNTVHSLTVDKGSWFDAVEPAPEFAQGSPAE
jgi:gentisate 1,2-dioxygenase